MSMSQRIPPEIPDPGRPFPGSPGPGFPGPSQPGQPGQPGRPGPQWPGTPPPAEPSSPARRPPGDGDWSDRLHEQLLARRIVLVHGFVDTLLATTVCAQLMALDGPDDAPVRLQLRTPDAELEAAFAIIDTMDGLSVPVHATAVGEVGGCALGILAAARRRQATPHASLRLTEPRVRFEGGASDLVERERQHGRLVDALYFRLSDVTGREVDEIRCDARAGRFLSAADAVGYGLVASVTSGHDAPPDR